MGLAPAAVERAMKLQEGIMRALSGTITWLQAAAILGLERLRARYEAGGAVALSDHQVQLSYSFVKLTLQEAGLVPKARARGRHRRQREPRAGFGELLHLDGSPHPWLRRCPEERAMLITVVDDATKRLLYAQLWPGETTAAVFAALHAIFTAHGLPIALYTDRARWAFCTSKAGGPIDRTHPTQVGRALAQLGIEHIGAYSPQARGRASASTGPCRAGSSTSSPPRASAPWPPRIPTLPSDSSPTTPTSSPTRPRIPPPPSSPCTASIATPSSANKCSGW
jgi:hypothetical protein